MLDYYKKSYSSKKLYRLPAKEKCIIIMLDIKAETMGLEEPLDVTRIVLEHEEKVRTSIYRLNNIVKKNYEYGTEIFMHR